MEELEPRILLSLTAPTGIEATDATIVSEVQVNWNTVSGATSYTVWRNTTNNSGTATKIASSLTGTSYIDPTASKTTLEYYWVTAANSTQTSGFGSYAIGLAELSAPTGLIAKDSPSNEVSLSWIAVSGATTGYSVFRNTSNNLGSATRIAPDVAGTSYADNPPSPATTYYYWVEAENPLQTGAAAGPVTGSVTAVTPLSTPTGLTATYATIPNEVKVTWNAANGATSYTVWRNTTNNSGTATKIASGLTVTSYTDPTASTTTASYYWVTAVSGSQTSAYGSPAMGLAELPGPSGLTATTNLGSKVELTWNAVAGATGYSVFRNTSNNLSMATEINDDVTSIPYSDTSASIGTTYYYWVKPFNTLQTGPAAGPADGVAQTETISSLSTPTGVTATYATIVNEVQVAWNTVNGAVFYNVWRSTTNSSGTATEVASGLTGTSYIDPSASTTTVDYYWITAVNGSLTSNYGGSADGLAKLAVPGGVAATSDLDEEVQVTWDAVTGATTYNVWRSTTNSFGSATKIQSGIAGTSYYDTSASTTGDDYYWVTASNSLQTGNDGGPAEGYALLSAPGDLTATTGAIYPVDITWNAVTGATAYRVFRNTVNNLATATDIAPDVTGTTTYLDSSVGYDTPYYYWVEAYNVFQSSAPAGSVQGESTILAAPTGVTATYATIPSEVQVSWNSVVDATTYYVYRNNTDNSGTATDITPAGVTGNSYLDTTASTSTVDYYWVQASNGNAPQNSPLGGPAEGLAELPAPTNVAATSFDCNEIVVTWNAVAGATGYNVFRNTSDDFGTARDIAPDVVPVTGVQGTAYADTTATVGTTYYYWVQPINALQNGVIAGPANGVAAALPSSASYDNLYDVYQIRQAYQFASLSFTGSGGESVLADGAGQTIAIIDADIDPTIFSDVDTFDQAMSWDGNTTSLYTEFGAATSFLTQVTLPNTTPPTAVGSDWAIETALDVEWAHAIAPAAQILLVETPNADLDQGVAFAETYTSTASPNGVNVISMSWGTGEYFGEASYDSLFTTPAGHQGITFVAGAGDWGGVPFYPASSPNVLSVGGTSLILTSGGYYAGESAWGNGTYGNYPLGSKNGGGGGDSQYESIPGYQSSAGISGTQLETPDVAYDADPNTGMFTIDSSYANAGPYVYPGSGTSAGAPQWAALIAIADQGREIAGETSLDGPSQVLPELFSIYANATEYASAFNDITTGSTGHNAGPGFDLATGLGTPIVNNLVPYLVGLPDYAPADAGVQNQVPDLNDLSISPQPTLSLGSASNSQNTNNIKESRLVHWVDNTSTYTPGLINGFQLSYFFNPMDQLTLQPDV